MANNQDSQNASAQRFISEIGAVAVLGSYLATCVYTVRHPDAGSLVFVVLWFLVTVVGFALKYQYAPVVAPGLIVSILPFTGMRILQDQMADWFSATALVALAALALGTLFIGRRGVVKRKQFYLVLFMAAMFLVIAID